LLSQLDAAILRHRRAGWKLPTKRAGAIRCRVWQKMEEPHPAPGAVPWVMLCCAARPAGSVGQLQGDFADAGFDTQVDSGLACAKGVVGIDVALLVEAGGVDAAKPLLDLDAYTHAGRQNQRGAADTALDGAVEVGGPPCRAEVDP